MQRSLLVEEYFEGLTVIFFASCGPRLRLKRPKSEFCNSFISRNLWTGDLEITQLYRTFSWTPGLSVNDQVVAKGNCTAAIDRSRGADSRRILARRSLFRGLNRAMETSAKMKFLLDQIQDVGVRCSPTIDFI